MRATDQELVEQVTQGDDPEEAFSLVVARHADMVYSTCWRILRNESQAADITQETFYQLYKNAERIRGCLGGWLHRVATNRCLDLIRQEGARRRREEKYVEYASANGNAWKEVEPLVDEALDNLPEELRQVIAMHYLEQKTTVQIAAAMGVSQPTISRRLKEGLEVVREHLRRSGVMVGVVPLQTILIHGAQLAPEALLRKLGKIALTHAATSAETTATAVSAGIGGKTTLAGGAVVAAMIISAVWMLRSPPNPPAQTAPSPASITSLASSPTPQAQPIVVGVQTEETPTGPTVLPTVTPTVEHTLVASVPTAERVQVPTNATPELVKPTPAMVASPFVPVSTQPQRMRVPTYGDGLPLAHSYRPSVRLAPESFQLDARSYHTFLRRRPTAAYTNSTQIEHEEPVQKPRAWSNSTGISPLVIKRDTPSRVPMIGR